MYRIFVCLICIDIKIREMHQTKECLVGVTVSKKSLEGHWKLPGKPRTVDYFDYIFTILGDQDLISDITPVYLTAFNIKMVQLFTFM